MITSTPKKAIFSQSNSFPSCIVCGISIEHAKERIAVFGKSECDIKGIISLIVGGELQTSESSCQSPYICKKCYYNVKKVDNLACKLNTLESELRACMISNSGHNTVRMKRCSNESRDEVSYISQVQNSAGPAKPVLGKSKKSAKKSLFNPVSIEPYPVNRGFFKPSLAPLLVTALPICGNPTLLQRNKVLPRKDTRDDNNTQCPSVQVNKLLFITR